MTEFDYPPRFLEPSEYEVIKRLMVTQAPVRAISWRGDTGARFVQRSFAGNMAKILATRPEVFLFTHKSAVPLADSVRAYYDALGLETPELGIVNTKDEEGASEEYEEGTWYWDQRARNYRHDPARREAVAGREVPKLVGLVQGRRVAIIDQFISDGVTMLNARDITTAAGAASIVRPDYAKWFNDAREEDIDFEAMSSVHREFMQAVGRAAAQADVAIPSADDN